jgi:DNA sulfur modification protein DndB
MKEDGLVKREDIRARLINAKASPYICLTAKPGAKDRLESEGWEFVPSKLKKSIRMRKSKTHFDAFEDRVWALLARLRFAYLNHNNRFGLEYIPGVTKRIDVFACDEEAVLIIECKSSATRGIVNYQKEINELIGIKDGLRQAAHKLVDGKPKVAFIFATNKAILSENDRRRLAEGAIVHLTETNIEYWEQLANHLGPAAKYQFFGRLFAGQEIPNLPNRVPAIKGKMSSGHTFYSFSVEPEFLLRIGCILHRTDSDIEASEAYQRLVSKKRLQDIGKFIDQGGYFPNSIIVSIATKRNRKLRFDYANPIDHDSDTSLGVLHLPKAYRSAFIIDGQHRLYGYSRSKSKSHHTIPVVAFVNLPTDEQAKIFIDINHQQKSVPTNILRSIMADFNWNSEDSGAAISALKTRLLSRMNFDDGSPFFKRIVLAEEKSTNTRCLTLETILKWGLASKTGFFGRVKGKKLVKTGYLTCGSHAETLDKSLSFFRRCFDYVQSELPDQWNAGSGEGGFICMNIGIAATLRTIDHVLDHLVRIERLKPEDLTGQQLGDQVTPYLLPVLEFVKGLDKEGLKKLRSYFGSGAPEKVTMEFLNSIHAEFGDFNPDGLAQWIKEHTGQFNMPSWDLGHNHIEPLIHEFVVTILKKEYGEKAWWNYGVSKDIQKECSDARIDNGSAEPDWHFLNTIHYRSIIEKNWGLLGEFFTPPGMHNASKEKRLSWLVRLNSLRQKYSHPQRDIITEEEHNYLQELDGWLETQLVQARKD